MRKGPTGAAGGQINTAAGGQVDAAVGGKVDTAAGGKVDAAAGSEVNAGAAGGAKDHRGVDGAGGLRGERGAKGHRGVDGAGGLGGEGGAGSDKEYGGDGSKDSADGAEKTDEEMNDAERVFIPPGGAQFKILVDSHPFEIMASVLSNPTLEPWLLDSMQYLTKRADATLSLGNDIWPLIYTIAARVILNEGKHGFSKSTVSFGSLAKYSTDAIYSPVFATTFGHLNSRCG